MKRSTESEFSFHNLDLIWDESIAFKGQTWHLVLDTIEMSLERLLWKTIRLKTFQDLANEVCTRAICHVQIMFLVDQIESVK